MTVFMINADNEMVEAPRVQLEKEQQLEDWLSNSPWAVANEDLLIIGRQAKAYIGSNNRYPDLLALDKDGKITIIELKKGKAPREVVAQLLEYAAWASRLSEEQIIEIASIHLTSDFHSTFKCHFEVDEVPPLGHGLRLFVAAEEIPISVAEVCRFLRQSLGLDICCVSYETYRDPSGHTLVDSSLIVGGERLSLRDSTQSSNMATSSHASWNGQTPVKEIIWQAVSAMSNGNPDFTFSPKEIIDQISSKYPEVNRSTIRCQISSDCVNHPSRHHWPGGKDRYWQISKGKYRLYRNGIDKKQG